MAGHMFLLLPCGMNWHATVQQWRMQHTICTVCRDLYNDIAIPGGIAMKSFSETWGQFCQGMDYNDYSLLQSPAKQLLTMISK